MKVLLWLLAAVCAYVISGINLAIVLSKSVYHKDIRTLGSGNPGFTNFRRVFGGPLAWVIFVFDIVKAALPALVFGALIGKYCGMRELGAAFTGAFSLLGHAFPFLYGFKGGKGFLVCLGTLFVLSPLAGLIAFAVLCVLLLTTKYMSLSTMVCLVVGTVLLIVFGIAPGAVVLYALCVAFMIRRHRENICRLIAGTESKFSFGKH